MDDLDAMIIRDLVFRPTDPLAGARGVRRPWDIARSLGLHGTTVKRRIADMREKGILRGIHLMPAPVLAGRRGSEYHFIYKDASAKRRAFDSVAADPNVWEAYGLVGNQLFAVIASPPGEDGRTTADRIAKDTGAIETRYHHASDWPVPVDRISALDLRVMAAFAEDAFRPVQDAAAEVGVAPKTITTRMRALAKARAFFVHPQIDYSKLDGGFNLYLDLTLALGATENAHVEIPNRFPLALCRSPRGAENAYVVVHAAGATDVEDILRRAQSIPDVVAVQMHILHDVHHEPARWKDALLARAEELARASGMWSPTWRARPTPVARTK